VKKLIIIFLLIPIFSFGQWIGGPGEYVSMLLNNATHRAYSLNNGVPTLVTEVTNVSQVIGGPHSAALIDNVGKVYAKGQNGNGVVPCGSTSDQSNFVLCMTDINGATLDPVVQVTIGGNGNHGLFWNIFAVTSSGKLYGAGELEGYVAGDGTAGLAVNTRWVPINVGGKLVKKIQGGYGMLALCTDGTVYTWGADRDGFINGQGTTTAATIPTQVVLPLGKTAIDIASNGLVHAVVLSDSTKAMTGQQNLNDYTGFFPRAMTRVFQDVTNDLALPHGAAKVFMNSSTTYWILSDGELWSHGDNSCGTIGNGDMLDWSAYKCCPGPSLGSPAPYNYDNGFHEHMVIHPVQVIPGKTDWTGIGTCPSNSWFVYAWDSQNRLYSWGRNKFGPLINGIIGANPLNGAIGAAFPDSWSVPRVTEQHPSAIIAYTESTSPYCLLNPSVSPCNSYTETDKTKPIPSLTARRVGNTIIWDASGSTDNTRIVSYLHTQTAGPTLNYKICTGPIDTVAFTSLGTYTSKIVVVDKAFNTDSITATIVITDTPIVSAGFNQIISLPTTSVNLVGSITTNAGVTVNSISWTQLSGPSVATMNPTNTSSTTVSNLIVGIYFFQLRVVDSNGMVGTSQVQVTVNSVPYNGIIINSGKIKRFIRF
jgi:alpha-tubulin suppressor-like RCC1 family protein